MRVLYKLGPRWRAAAFPFFCLGLVVAGVCLSGCTTGSAGGPFPATFPECMNASNPLPWWQTYPCNLINGSEGP